MKDSPFDGEKRNKINPSREIVSGCR